MNKQELNSMLNDGKSMNDIAKETGKSLGTIRYWCTKFNLKSQYGNLNKGGEKAKRSVQKFRRLQVDESHLDYSRWSENQRRSYSYLLGLYLGDGHLSYDRKRGGRSYTLVITNHIDLVNMNNRIQESMKILFPNKSIHLYQKKREDGKIHNGLDIKLTAINLHLLFPHGDGKKHTRKIELTQWQSKIIDEFPKEFIKGMIESDGCRFAPRKKQCPTYIIYQFSNCSIDLHLILQNAAKKIGVNFTFREVKSKESSNANWTRKFWTVFAHKKDVLFLDTFIGAKS